MKLTGTPTLKDEPGLEGLTGKSLGLINGSTWVSLWGTWFGRKHLPGVKLVHAGGDHVQLHFMEAHRRGNPCPPQENIKSLVKTAREVVRFHPMDAILITCSTMNRASNAVRTGVRETGSSIPVIQIDEPMMEMAVSRGGHILVVATHGPSVSSTQALLREAAEKAGKTVSFSGATIETAFEILGTGDITAHNRLIADAIRKAQKQNKIGTVVLAQLSMAVFSLEYPDPISSFGVPVLNSGDCGFQRVRELLLDA